MEEILKVLGEDPAASQSLNLDIHPTFVQRWKFWIRKGVPEKDKEKLLGKYVRPEELEAPMLNAEIIVSLGDSASKRDSHRRETQFLAGSALTAIGAVLTMCSKEEDIDKIEVIERLLDTQNSLQLYIITNRSVEKHLFFQGCQKKLKQSYKKLCRTNFSLKKN
ncbi:uncharacterized protein LOC109504477 [Harpegnathos saltator]|uniref:uncharacterized protein LOC109504477 n=1 Tax=Harpegnathos saltator TaxID=610380 RepID=UPI000DBEE408|nr:uncharacterized protein LOC109504477 [Harpegnathos saltator]